ncbi:cytochrome d ubiquinol oxidase subunit II [Streptomyces sp. NPDC051018]|uniref:cytochrome d ubiquinol oxidase subunit II n=1 Tax=Streptomyces sp. NPDC051018 TaxID=3365639 RepID=UPI0037A06184
MDLPDVLLIVLWTGLTAYVLFGGADFGAGIWDLLAGGTERGRPQRALVEHSIGPVWEANHVWLIFIIVLTWTGLPSAFAAIASTLYIPLTAVALGIIARGSAFAFRKVSRSPGYQRLFGATFAFSSLVTPFFLGAVAGAIASGRVPPGIAEGDLVTSWANPTSLITGALAIGTAAYLAAVYLTRDAQRTGDAALTEALRRRALAAGVVVGVLAVLGLIVLHADAPVLFGDLTHWAALPLLIVSVASGIVSLALLAHGRYLVAVRMTAALAVTGLLWGWGVAQYPDILPGLPLARAAATDRVLAASLGSLAAGALLLIPSLWWLYATFQRDHGPAESGTRT